jgi:hypothetical protein
LLPKKYEGLIAQMEEWYYADHRSIRSMIFGGMIQKLARRAAEIAADAKT